MVLLLAVGFSKLDALVLHHNRELNITECLLLFVQLLAGLKLKFFSTTVSLKITLVSCIETSHHFYFFYLSIFTPAKY